MKKVKRWVDYVLFVSRFQFGYMLELPLGCFTKIKKILKKLVSLFTKGEYNIKYLFSKEKTIDLLFLE